MKVHLYTIFCVLTILPSLSFSAEGVDFVYEQEQKKNFISFGTFLTNVSSSQSNVNGLGVEVSFFHFLNPSWAFQISGGHAFDIAEAASLYTMLKGGFEYALLGEFTDTKNKLSLKDKTIFHESKKHSSVLSVMFLFEQLYFNGTTNVFPATGPRLGVKYRFKAFNTPLALGFSYGFLTAENKPLNSANLSISTSWSF